MTTDLARRILDLIDEIDTFEDDALLDGVNTLEELDALVAQAQRVIAEQNGE